MRTPPIAGLSVAVILAITPACRDSTGPRTGSLTFQVSITGVPQDTSFRYIINVDGGAPKTVRALQILSVTDLPPGEHQIVLTGMADNCSVTGQNPRTVVVTAGHDMFIQFVLDCAPNIGHVRVTTATSGASIDPDGYALIVNRRQTGQIGVTASGIFDVPVGSATIELASVARNCLVSPTSRTIVVSFNTTVDAHFDVTCLALGSLQVTTSTSGTDTDPDGFAVILSAPGFSGGGRVDINSSKTITDLAPGDYTVTLAEVAPNCDAAGANPRVVTIGEGASVATTFTVTCGALTQIAYASNVTGDAEIYAMSSNGAGNVRLTTSPHDDFWPAWSPDGQKIAFESWRDGHAEVYVMNANGTQVTRLTHDQGLNFAPAWSPDGSHLAFASTRNGQKQLYVMNADGSEQTRLMSNTANDEQAAWSPDGQDIAFVSDRDGNAKIYVVRVATGVVRRLTNLSVGDRRPAWSPDGTLIAFYRTCDYYATDCGLYTMRADGTGVTQVLAFGSDPAWSPDGKRLAFSQSNCDYYYYECTYVIAAVKIDGTGYVRLTNQNEFHPAWRR